MIPTRKRLAGPLLDEVYALVKKMVRERERRCPGPMSICFDGSHIQRRHCLNVLTNLSDGTDIFRESICTLENRVTGEYMAGLMEKQISDIGVENICSVGTDNTSSVVKARRLICESIPTLIDVGDGPHCVDLLIEDAVKDIEEFKQALENCKTIISFVKSHTYVDAFHQSLANEMNKPYAMKYFPETRFAYVEKMVREIMRTWAVLQGMLANDHSARWDSATSAIESSVVQSFFDLVRNPTTLDNFTATLEYTKPLSSLCHELESNSLRFADVLPLAVKTFGVVQGVNVRGFQESSRQSLLRISKRRLFGESNTRGLVVLLRPEHFAATILDPIFRPATVNQVDVGNAVNSIRKFFRGRQEAGERAVSQFSDYCLKQMCFDRAASQGLIWKESEDNAELDFNAAIESRRSVARSQAVNWWRLYGSEASELQQFAVSLACTSPQAVSADRSFSIQKSIHTTGRSRLSISSVDKATFCYFNLRSVYDCPAMRRKAAPIAALIADIEDAMNEDDAISD